MSELSIQRFKGNQALPYIDDLARLRLTVFKEYPYLYQGNMAYEKEYLQTYAACKESVLVIVKKGDEVVGVSSAIPLAFETEECQKPFIEHNMPIEKIFYFGESVVLPEYRGKGIYRHFFNERENAAVAYGSSITVFCAVARDESDPRRPDDYVSLNSIWEHFGYQQHPELVAYYEWKELDSNESTRKPMVFWTKTL